MDFLVIGVWGSVASGDRLLFVRHLKDNLGGTYICIVPTPTDVYIYVITRRTTVPRERDDISSHVLIR